MATDGAGNKKINEYMNKYVKKTTDTSIGSIKKASKNITRKNISVSKILSSIIGFIIIIFVGWFTLIWLRDKAFVPSPDFFYVIDAASGNQKAKFEIPKTDPKFYIFDEIAICAQTKSAYYYSESDMYLYALDVKTGKNLGFPKVEVKDGNFIFASGMIFVKGEYGVLYALDAKTFKEKWRLDSAQEKNLHSKLLLVDSNTVYFITNSGASNKNIFYALNARTGEIKWMMEKSLLAEERARGFYAAAAGGIVCFSVLNRMYAFDAMSGKETWEYSSKRGAISVTAAFGDIVYFYDDLGLTALDLRTGKENLFLKSQGWGIFYDRRHGVFIDFSPDYSVYGYNAKTGKKIWEFKPILTERFPHEMVNTNGKIYFVSGEYVYALDGSSGKELWKFNHPEYIDSLSLAEGAIYLAGHAPTDYKETDRQEKGFLGALDSDTGQEKWETEIRSAGEHNTLIQFAPAILKDDLYLLTYDKLIDK